MYIYRLYVVVDTSPDTKLDVVFLYNMHFVSMVLWLVSIGFDRFRSVSIKRTTRGGKGSVHHSALALVLDSWSATAYQKKQITYSESVCFRGGYRLLQCLNFYTHGLDHMVDS